MITRPSLLAAYLRRTSRPPSWGLDRNCCLSEHFVNRSATFIGCLSSEDVGVLLPGIFPASHDPNFVAVLEPLLISSTSFYLLTQTGEVSC